MWKRVVGTRGSNGVVKAKFRHNLPNCIIIWYWTILIFLIFYLLTDQERISIETWQRSSKDCAKADYGVASMSSTELLWLHCLSSRLKLRQLRQPKRLMQRFSCFWTIQCLSCLSNHALTLLQWIQNMLVDRNCQKT